MVGTGCKHNKTPSCTINQPVNNEYFEQLDTININVIAKDDDGMIKHLQLFLDNEKIDSTNNTMLETQIYAENLDTGKHTLTATVCDNEDLFGMHEQQIIINPLFIPDVETLAITDITDSTAKIAGTVADPGGAGKIQTGICWSVNATPTTEDKFIFCSEQDNFSAVIDSLDHYTTYYVRAFAQNKAGTGYGETKSFKTLKTMNMPCPGNETLSDSDGNTYKTVQIGDQCWMAENLNTGKQLSSGKQQTDNDTIEKYCYNNDPASCEQEGALYQWNEMMKHQTTQDSAAVQGICPDGWHIPTENDWLQLEEYIGMDEVQRQKTYWRGTDEGKKIKQGGKTGFNALLGGQLDEHNVFVCKEKLGFYWTGTLNFPGSAWHRVLSEDEDRISRFVTNTKEALSIRCIKD